jgi:hypothetical protein
VNHGHAQTLSLARPLRATLRGRLGLPGVRGWIDANGGRVMQFLVWSKGYRRPDGLKP